MQISWHGYSAFRLQNDGMVVLTDPFDSLSEVAIKKQPADIVISSRGITDIDEYVNGKPFVVSRPGEYEVRTIFVHAIAHRNGSDEHLLSVITMDTITVAFLGSTSVTQLNDAEYEMLEGADILIVPVGGGLVTAPKEAAQLVNRIEPRIVIPSYYRVSGSKGLEPVESFLKEIGGAKETIDKLRISKKDLQNEDTKVVVLTYAG